MGEYDKARIRTQVTLEAVESLAAIKTVITAPKKLWNFIKASDKKPIIGEQIRKPNNIFNDVNKYNEVETARLNAIENVDVWKPHLTEPSGKITKSGCVSGSHTEEAFAKTLADNNRGYNIIGETSSDIPGIRQIKYPL